MPYTQEQIDKALSHIKDCYVIVGKCEQKPYKVKNSTYGDMIYSSGGECTIDLKADIDIILAALEATEKERDEERASKENWIVEAIAAGHRAMDAEAYAEKLKNAGDELRADACGAAALAWDAARKEKP